MMGKAPEYIYAWREGLINTYSEDAYSAGIPYRLASSVDALLAERDALKAENDRLDAGWHKANQDKLECALERDALKAENELLRDFAWVATEHAATHFGEDHNVTIQGRAALTARGE